MRIVDQVKVKENSEKIPELITQQEIPYHTITNRHVKTAFKGVMHYFPISSHKALVELQESNGVDMGKSCRHHNTAGKMILAISKTYLDDLLHIIKNTPKPVSIILDGSSDNSNQHYMSTLFQYFGRFIVTADVV